MMKDDDFKLLRGFADKWKDEQTFVIVESLLQLKKSVKPFLNKQAPRAHSSAYFFEGIWGLKAVKALFALKALKILTS